MEEQTKRINDYSHSVHKALRPVSPYLLYIGLLVILLVFFSNVIISALNFQRARLELQQMQKTEENVILRQQDIQSGIDFALTLIVSGIVGSIIVLVTIIVMAKQNSTGNNRASRDFEKLLDESIQQSQELASLLDASRSVFKCREFSKAAGNIFGICKKLTGATSGYVALLNQTTNENDVVFLDAGSMKCKVDQDFPMQVEGFRQKVYDSGKAIFDNNISDAEWGKNLPRGHIALKSILFAPLIIDGQPVGLLGLANKPGGFTQRDARVASAFCDIAEIALINSRAFGSLQDNQIRLKEASEELEDRVRQRTSALLKSNQQLLTEIIEHKKAEEKVTSRLRYEHGLADFAKCLLSGFKSSQVMDNALKQLLKAMQISRVFLHEVFYDDSGIAHTRNVSEASIICIDSMQHVLGGSYIDRHEVFGHWKDELSEGRYVKANIEDLTDAQRKIFKDMGVVSTLLLPIHINGKWYGVIGFDDASDHRHWSREDISLLRTAADLVTIYLSRIQTLGELIAYQDKLRSLASKLTQTEERERRRIAGGLHDEIIQPMIFIKIKLDMLKRQAADPELQEACTEMMSVIDKLTEDTRQFTFELSCPVLHEVGLEAALEDFMDSEICEKHGVLTEFEHTDEPIDLGHDMNVFLYKSARELLTNMVKHADASTVRVSLTRENESVVLSVEDDGVGFDMHKGPVDVNRPSGFGLFSIRERLSCLGGNLHIDSKPGCGTRAVMTAPIKSELSSIGD